MLPQDSATRKGLPMARGLIDYFPDALAAVSAVSMAGAEKHKTFDEYGNPTWDKSKSTDHADCIVRHLADRGEFQKDGHRHSAALAWRALALLQIELDNAKIQVAGVDQFKDFEAAAQGGAALAPKEWPGTAAEAEALKKSYVTGYDPATPGGDKTVYVLAGDTGIDLAYFAKLLGVPVEDILDTRVPPIPLGYWWCQSCSVFHKLADRNDSTDLTSDASFRKKWYDRRFEFPQQRNGALYQMTPKQN